VKKVSQWISVLSLVLAILAGGCASGGKPSPTMPPTKGAPGGSPQEYLAALEEVQGWKRADKPRLYTSETLFGYMDGEAELYFTYNLQNLAMQEFQAAGKENLVIELYEVAAPADAYGLFTYYRTGAPVSVGKGGAKDSGRRVSFWQGRYYGRVFAMRGELDDETLLTFAQRLTARLPQEGEPPQFISSLPAQGLQAESIKFFHDKMAQNNVIWLVPENILNLSRETDAVVADYRRGSSVLRLLVVRYLDANAAAAALQAVKGADVPNLAYVGQAGKHLVLVIGAQDADAKALGEEASAALRQLK